MRYRLPLIALAAAAGWIAAPSPARAQEGAGVRAGVSGDPTQFFFGGHVETSPLAERLRFRPNVEIGIGDNRTLVSLNVEFAWHFPESRRGWSLYAGAGPAVNFAFFDDDRPGRDGSDAGGGLNFFVGIEHAGGVFTELKVGAIDSPGVKFAVGYVFGR